MLTLGVEEEYLLVDPATGLPCAEFDAVRAGVPAPEVQAELLQSQIEVATPICRSLDEVRVALIDARRAVAAAARRRHRGVVASGTAPVMDGGPPAVTRQPRYTAMRTDAARLVDEQLICGMHVHVAMPDRETAVRVLNRLRPWLPLLVALGGNSPLWHGQDTGFASWRTVVFGRWPVTGIPPVFASAAEYDARLDDLHRAGVIRDRGQVYWLARISERYPTLEVRALDVQLQAEDAQGLAGVVRALVATALLAEESTAPPVGAAAPELLAGALWHASRYGLGAQLVDPARGERRDAAAMVKDLLDHVGPALAACGDEELVPSVLDRLLHAGTGADRQRQALAAGRGRPAALIAYLTDQIDAQ